MSERAVPFHCPYCGDENLRPHETDHEAGLGAWECRACLRAFTLKMLGMIPHGGSAPVNPDRGPTTRARSHDPGAVPTGHDTGSEVER